MIEGLILATNTFFEGSIGDLIYQWEQMGFFSHLLPFLLVFALVFGILDKTRIFKDNRMISGIISLVVGLLVVRSPMVTDFFQDVFPRAGIGLSLILLLIIFIGIFIPKANWVSYTLLGIAAIIFLVILNKSAEEMGWTQEWLMANWPMIGAGIFILIIVAVIVGSSQKEPPFRDTPLMNALFGKEKD